ncbi:MAG: FAD-dependent oxidoreductase [Parvularculaceae bacterium]
MMKILVIGGGIGGLTSAIALRRKGFDVHVIEKDPDWSVYGVGIIQQANVVRAVAELGILNDYLDAGFAFDGLEIYAPSGECVAKVPSPKLAEGYPANVGIGRPALHKVLGDHAKKAGASISLGVTVTELDQDGDGVDIVFSDGKRGRFDVVIGADGLYSQTRSMLFPNADKPEFTGQAVWRYNFTRPADLDCLQVYDGPTGVGLVPLSDTLMYMYVTTPEPGNPRYARKGLAEKMRAKIANCSPQIRALGKDITDDDGVVYKPLEWLFVKGDWSKGRIVLLGDAVHGTTPHLGQGAGMAIEDSLVLADELSKSGDHIEAAFAAYRDRRFERCKYIVDASLGICMGQLGKAPPPNNAVETQKMFDLTSQPI